MSIKDRRNSFKTKERRNRLILTALFSVATFINFFVAMLIETVCIYILIHMGAVSLEYIVSSKHTIWFMIITSTLLGALIAGVTSRFMLKPIHKIINSMNKLSMGDYSERMNLSYSENKSSVMRDVAESFNTLAEELENTEMLRSDFINNFSHEFKTPIVSIAGFAKLLKKGNLTEEQRGEYAGIIEEESMRLAYMATNVLNLTKIENQAILTNLSSYNLSEQIRSCILLLESKWSEKKLELQVDFGEYEIYANEEMLKQVWINLLDNAIKFSPEYGVLRVDIAPKESNIEISITNTGDTIPKDKIDKIFNKFYQADESHSTRGNGIGLAIVKRVTELHGGSVYVVSSGDVTTFTVELPG